MVLTRSTAKRNEEAETSTKPPAKTPWKTKKKNKKKKQKLQTTANNKSNGSLPLPSQNVVVAMPLEPTKPKSKKNKNKTNKDKDKLSNSTFGNSRALTGNPKVFKSKSCRRNDDKRSRPQQPQQVKQALSNVGPSRKRPRAADASSTTTAVPLQLPSKLAGDETRLHKVPWKRQSGSLPVSRSSSTVSAASSSSSASVRLPTDDVDRQALHELTEELHAFADYVRLQPVEVQARRDLIQHLTHVVHGIPQFVAVQQKLQQQQQQRQSAGGGPFASAETNDNNNNNHALAFSPFGSFAAPAVCSFESDVDLALWGAVPHGPPPPSPPVRAPKTSTPSPQELKRQREQRWSQALAHVDLENAMSPGDIVRPTCLDDSNDNHDNHNDTKGPGNDKNKKDGSLEPSSSSSPNEATPTANSNEPSVASKDDNDEPHKNETTTHREENDDENTGDEPPLFVLDRVGCEVAEEDGGGVAAPTVEEPLIDNNNKDEHPAASTRDAQDVHTNGPSSARRVSEDDTDEPLSRTTVGNDTATMEHPKRDTINDAQQDNEPEAGAEGSDSDADSADKLTPAKKPPAKRELEEDESEATSAPEEDDEDDDGKDGTMEVGFYLEEEEEEKKNSRANNVAAPQLNIKRQDAVDALTQLYRKLRKSQFAMSRPLLIRKARVPIIKFQSRIGVEVDISIGGLNQADTSLYAATLSERYVSFAPVVLVLKILMGQHKLDIPFEGGLGSFKLYVLVAHHIQRHLSLGGVDDPGHVLMSFLFRYGGPATGDHCVDPVHTKTWLGQQSLITCGDTGCVAELKHVTLLRQCRHLFAAVWKRLWTRMRQTTTTTTVMNSPTKKKKNSKKTNKHSKDSNQEEEPAPSISQEPTQRMGSFLAELVHVDRLKKARQQCLDWAVTASQNKTNKTSRGERNRTKGPPPPISTRQGPPPLGDKTAAQLVAGYDDADSPPPRKRIRTGAS